MFYGQRLTPEAAQRALSSRSMNSVDVSQKIVDIA
jgi:hypothetical protein